MADRSESTSELRQINVLNINWWRILTMARCTLQFAALILAAAVVAVAAVLLDAAPAFAHCDGLDGPVVAAARIALQTGDLNSVLIWIRPEDVGQIRRAFEQTSVVRKLGPQAQELADRYFFETLVRLHRAGEASPFTGLKPAGRDLGPAIPAADKALETGSDNALVEFLTARLGEGVHKRFQNAIQRKRFEPDNIAAGREYVEAYVAYVHYIERLYRTIEAAADAPLRERSSGRAQQ